MTIKTFTVLGAFLALLSFIAWYPGDSNVSYNTDVKPILNKHCMGCHGGVKKAGNVSFLFENEMLQPGKSGKRPVVRGDVNASEMIRRITTDDPEEKMPKNAPALSKEEVEILKQWVKEGAVWETHWAYQKPERPEIPSSGNVWNLFGLLNNDRMWPRNAIDHFVLDKLKDNELRPAPEADKAMLIRRVSLDLTGLPPTEKEVADFTNDKSSNAYEKVVDRLLKSDSYGEKWASMWMDLARYSDTKGYERDGARNIWRYRDYVIKSFNEDKPFDQFTIEQLAGDLLPQKNGLPTEEQLIATAFHRNTMNNDEGGTVDEEFRVAAQIDRVGTTWEVWQGTTFACIQCHSHPYDPISHDEYYKYMAFFNNTRDEDVPTETPVLRIYKNEDSAQVQKILDWVEVHNPKQLPDFARFMRIVEPKINSHDFKRIKNATLLDSKFLGIKHQGSALIPGATLSGKSSLLMQYGTKAEKAMLTICTDTTETAVLTQFQVPNTAGKDTVIQVALPAITGRKDLYFSLDSPGKPDEWVRVKWVSFQEDMPGKGDDGYREMVAAYAGILIKRADETPIFWEGQGDLARKTNVFVRGNWLVKGAEVKPEVPKLFFPMPQNYPQNRLGLAKWMIHRDNPLTARVIVNRFWEQLFGRGIVETVEDFGSQGSEPSHRELLDWLAVSFMEENHWSVKKLLKEMVMSATYRQSSLTVEDKKKKDPYNIWLSHGPRVRLSAEQVRDQALAVSGLISSKMYGKSVMPPQPDGIWMTPYNGEKWIPSEGEDKYRRAVYTYWKRTSPYPAMMTFDAPTREFCQSRRIRTNTPLQALNTLNDPVFLEAAQQLAIKMKKSAATPQQQLAAGYRLLTFQPISKKYLDLLLRIYSDSRNMYKQKPQEAQTMLPHGNDRSAELAALTVSANVLLNLDAALTKE